MPERLFDSEGELSRYEALLQMADLVVRHHDLAELFRKLAERLRPLISYEFLNFSLHDPARNIMQVHVLEGDDLSFSLNEIPVEEAPSGWVWQHQQPLVLNDEESMARFPRMQPILKSHAVRCYCLFPLITVQRRLGALGFGSRKPDAYSDHDLRFLQSVAELAALAVENAQSRAALEQGTERLQVLLEVNAALVQNLDLQKLFPAISGFIRKVIRHDIASVALFDKATQKLRVYAADYVFAHELLSTGMEIPLKGTPAGQAFLEQQAKTFNQEQILQFNFPHADALVRHGIRSGCSIPLMSRSGPTGTLNFASREESAFSSWDVSLLKQIAGQVAVALDNARAYAEIAELKDKLAEEKLYLEGEIHSEWNFEEIIGESPVLKRAMDQAKTVAPSDATVLVLGPTGTGKELMARAIHRMSLRKEGPFIKMNCAAIPTGLLESELFGHERGAFTGAISQKIGRLELADRGTLFLDEIGDIPLELQPKLLRVLQDQEFERLGSTRTIRVNIRLIAATNQDLAKSVADKQFRSDLYYRLNVFPLKMPALVDRREDVPLLVRYFVHKFARRMNKRIDTVPSETMKALMSWNWPGNVRELENFIERSVILTMGGVLNAPLAELIVEPVDEEGDGTLESLEREHIIRTLKDTGGVIAGMHGAAARLGLKRTTLQSRIQRMGINRKEFEQ